ncbi:MAG: hypothetical protein M9918_24975 [Anaerolineae bacterium]|nr:hypothetical protein [Anaerolineae bacterium]
MNTTTLATGILNQTSTIEITQRDIDHMVGYLNVQTETALMEIAEVYGIDWNPLDDDVDYIDWAASVQSGIPMF